MGFWLPGPLWPQTGQAQAGGYRVCCLQTCCGIPGAPPCTPRPLGAAQLAEGTCSPHTGCSRPAQLRDPAQGLRAERGQAVPSAAHHTRLGPRGQPQNSRHPEELLESWAPHLLSQYGLRWGQQGKDSGLGVDRARGLGQATGPGRRGSRPLRAFPSRILTVTNDSIYSETREQPGLLASPTAPDSSHLGTLRAA